MLRSEFNYDLPEDLVAQYPTENRGDSRLLCLDAASGRISDRVFSELPALMNAGDILVFNDTRVIPARLFGNKETGGKVEILVERITETDEMLVQLRASKTPKPGVKILIDEQAGMLEVIEKKDDFYLVRTTDNTPVTAVLEKAGHVPLPPYIKRMDEQQDRDRYQTVYAKAPGAVAAPTAGLHFTQEMLKNLNDRGCNTGFVTLHVGTGTFQPVRTENVENHKMHSEFFCIEKKLCDDIHQARIQGGRIIAVGTTTVRVLESVTKRIGELKPQQGETDIFIYPGFEFKVVDALVTNFHLPESTLLMLVCAFAGKDNVMNAYAHAIREKYRFYSYGDAMFIDTATSYK